MTRYVKNLYERTGSVLNEGLADDVAKLLDVKKSKVEDPVQQLTFSKYLELGNAIDTEDEDSVRKILGMDTNGEEDELTTYDEDEAFGDDVDKESKEAWKDFSYDEDEDIIGDVDLDSDIDLDEADNPYKPITPPSEKGPVAGGGAQTDSGDEVTRKSIEDLQPGDEIEIKDVSGSTASAKVKYPEGPGDTVVVTGKQGNEHIIKKDSVENTPVAESKKPLQFFVQPYGEGHYAVMNTNGDLHDVYDDGDEAVNVARELNHEYGVEENVENEPDKDLNRIKKLAGIDDVSEEGGAAGGTGGGSGGASAGGTSGGTSGSTSGSTSGDGGGSSGSGTSSQGSTSAGNIAHIPHGLGTTSRQGGTNKKKKDHDYGKSIYSETASAGATGAGAVATTPVAQSGMFSRNPSIFGKKSKKPQPKKRKTKEVKSDGLGRNRKDK